MAISAASNESTLTIVGVISLKIASVDRTESLLNPPIICGNDLNSFIALPSAVLSGANARWKSIPQIKPDNFSSKFLTKSLVVPIGTVDLNITRFPLFNLFAIEEQEF